MPHDLDRNPGITILDGSDITQKVVALRLIVVQPPNRLVDRSGIDVHDGLTPDDVHACDSRPELVLKRLRRRIGFATPVREILLRYRLAAGGARPGSYDLESAHSPDLVWFTEFPNGSPSSSITDGGM